MKKYLILLVIVFSITTSNAQQKVILPTPSSKTFFWKDGNAKITETKFSYLIKEELQKELIDNIVMNVMVKSQYKLKNKLSYVPIKLTLMQTDDKYYAISEYKGKNGFGVESEMKTFFNFNKKGEIIEQ